MDVRSHETKGRPRALAAGARLALLALLAAAALVVAACGSDDGDSSASGGDGATAASGDAGVEEVRQLAEELQQRPTSIGITKPVGKEIPSGKEVWWISCGVPACLTLADTFTQGAKELGWKTRVINTDGTPEKIKSAWQQAVSAKPDAVASSGTDVSVITPQLEALEQADIPVVEYAIPEKVPGIDAVVGDLEGEALSYGEPMAAFISSDSNADAHTLLVNLPTFPILAGLVDGFERIYEKGCPDCELTTYDVPLSALGKDVASRVVSKLRATPDVDYVAMAVDDLTVGLPAALRAAGLQDKVKIVGATSGPTNYQYIESGQQAAGVPNAFYEDTWQMVDALARIFTGQSPKPSEVAPPRMLLTRDNLISTDAVFPLVPDFKEQFLKLWGKG